MRVLTRYKYVQFRVFRPLRRTRRTFCLVLFTVLLFGLFTLLLEVFNTSDRYRTFSMVPYSGNLSEVREQHLVSSVIRGTPRAPPHVRNHVVSTVQPISKTQVQHRKPVVSAIQPANKVVSAIQPANKVVSAIQPANKKPVLHKQYNHTEGVQTTLGYNNSKHLPSTRKVSLVPNISRVSNGGIAVRAYTREHTVLPTNGTSSDSQPRATSAVSKGSVVKQVIKVKPRFKYLSYKTKFTYPLEINIVALVNDAIQGVQYTKHKPINPHHFWYLHKPDKCAFRLKQNESENVLVLVKSFVGNVEQRVALRTLWGATNDSNMRRMFMLGYHRSHQLAVDNESRKYHDIIQENFVDDYMNNTYKTIMAYNWATKYCRRAHVILFLDDDYLVNMTVMASHVRTTYQNQSSGLYTGTLAKHAPPYRNKKDRWYLSFKQYPYDEFPPYVGGGAYVVSFDVAKRFKFAFPFVQYMGIDDVYLGIVARKLGIEARNDPHFDSHSNITIAKECSHTATELLNKVCPLGVIKKNVGRAFKRNKHKPVNATVFVIGFSLALLFIVMLTCCLSD